MEIYKDVGAYALGIFWLTVLIMLWALKGSRHKSISEHAASSQKVALVFTGVTLVTTGLWALFFVKWFIPNFELGLAFTTLTLAMVGLYAVAGTVPHTKGLSQKIHFISAVSASVLLLPIMAMLIQSRQVGMGARIFTFIAMLVMFVLGYIMLRKRRTLNQVLFYETMYFLCFDISILIVTYLG